MSGQILREGKALLTLYSLDSLGLFSERGTALETDGFHQNCVDVRASCFIPSTEERIPEGKENDSPGLLTPLPLEISESRSFSLENI